MRGANRRFLAIAAGMMFILFASTAASVQCCADAGGCLVSGGSSGGGAPNPPPWPVWNGGSSIPHNPNLAVSVQLTHSVRNWDADWVTHYNNALGWWNSAAGRPVFHDIAPDSDLTPLAWVLRPGTVDEIEANSSVFNATGKAFEPTPNCALSSNWAVVYPAVHETFGGHEHRKFHKICVQGGSTPVAPKSFNNEPAPGPWHYWWLTLVHELGHVLSMDDNYTNPSPCVMLQGTAMKHPCSNEINWVRHHYGF